MTALVVYASRQGCSEKSARLISRLLGDDFRIVDLDREEVTSLDGYDTVVIGGSIYYGQIRESVHRFCQNYLSELLQRRIGLYICCVQCGQIAEQELQQAFPPQLLAHAGATGIFGGEIHMERINFIERFIVRAVVRTDYRVTTFSEERVGRFVQQLLRG